MPTASPGRDPVFADSFVLIALLNPADAFHDRAVEAIDALAKTLVTTHGVLVEVADALCAPGYRTEVAAFLNELGSDPGVEIIPPDPTWYKRGLDLYARRPDKSWSLTDCISFVVMTDRGLTEALTGDHHFEQAGFRALLRSS
jgi:predicted nucleic acid-binding protein